MDKRTARREYKDDFMRGIENYQRKYLSKKETIAENTKVDYWQEGDIKVFVRKRPIFNHEIASGEFDVVTCLSNKVIVHDARMHADMKREMIHHNQFEFNYVFSDKMSNNVVYDKTARSLVDSACSGGFATALVYGQTGSGKV